jgi:hypothetical protein
LPGGEHEITFDGGATVDVLPISAARDGSPMLWSNAQDDVNTMLTREVDLTDAVAPVLTFATWFDIESWYDWGYVSVSTDGGDTWRALSGEHTTSADPVRIAYGPGYTGSSEEWLDERIDLQAYAGQEILLRFEYVTDGSTHGEGWAIDDIAIEEADVGDSLEDAGDWQFGGWVRIDRPLPQTWLVRLIAQRADGEPVVQDAVIGADGRGVLRFDATGLQDVVLAVAGTTEGTRRSSPYTVELVPSTLAP